MDRDWEEYARTLLRTEMMRRKITYEELVAKLADIGVKETGPNLRNKFSRRSFTAVLFIQCLIAMGVTTLRLEDEH